MLDKFVYFEDDRDLEPVLDELIEVMDQEEIAVKFILLQSNKRVDVLTYRKNKKYYIQEIYNHDNVSPKEIYNEQDMRKTLLLIMQACEENGKYDIVQEAI